MCSVLLVATVVPLAWSTASPSNAPSRLPDCDALLRADASIHRRSSSRRRGTFHEPQYAATSTGSFACRLMGDSYLQYSDIGLGDPHPSLSEIACCNCMLFLHSGRAFHCCPHCIDLVSKRAAFGTTAPTQALQLNKVKLLRAMCTIEVDYGLLDGPSNRKSNDVLSWPLTERNTPRGHETRLT